MAEFTVIAVVFASFCVDMVTSSVGDKSYIHRKCLQSCLSTDCTEGNLKLFHQYQPLSHRLLQWGCEDECRYHCMWKTVDAFQRDGMPVPQFYGKWPFVRWYGIQEPASMIFSMFNGLAHLCIFYYGKQVPSYTPMYYVWHGAAFTAMNAWFWSAVFHCRDTYFTEKMDYFCAFSIVLYNTFTLACRVFGTTNWWPPAIVGFGCLIFYIQHVKYLALTKFDYGYNMKVNIGVALFNMICWFLWCIHMRRNRYIYKAIISIIGIQMLLCLELLDFPPILWTFDAHALWHGGSWPLAIVWYSFIIDDGLFLARSKSTEILPQKID